jgi:transposase
MLELYFKKKEVFNMTQERRQRRSFTDKFKQQMVDLILSGKPQGQVIKEYDLSPSSLPKWIEQYGQTGSFKERDNLTDEQKELIELRKQNKQLEMENDILKQAALIMGRK